MSLKSKRLDVLFFIVGDILAAISVSCFTAPNEIAAGGLTGIATILFSLFSLPIGSTVLLLNIPIFIIAANKFGFRFMYKSIIATMLMTIFIDLLSMFAPVYKGEKILGAIFGGVFMGVGLALIFLRGATTGGVDVIAKMITIKYPYFSIGKALMAIDTLVIISAAIVYKNIENALYAAIVIFVQTKAIDTLIYGGDRGKLIFIESKSCPLIIERVSTLLGRMPCLITNRSAKRDIILCAARRYEAAKIHKIIKSIDDTAFVVTLAAGEIIGEGFVNYDEVT